MVNSSESRADAEEGRLFDDTGAIPLLSDGVAEQVDNVYTRGPMLSSEAGIEQAEELALNQLLEGAVENDALERNRHTNGEDVATHRGSSNTTINPGPGADSPPVPSTSYETNASSSPITAVGLGISGVQRLEADIMAEARARGVTEPLNMESPGGPSSLPPLVPVAMTSSRSHLESESYVNGANATITRLPVPPGAHNSSAMRTPPCVGAGDNILFPEQSLGNISGDGRGSSRRERRNSHGNSENSGSGSRGKDKDKSRNKAKAKEKQWETDSNSLAKSLASLTRELSYSIVENAMLMCCRKPACVSSSFYPDGIFLGTSMSGTANKSETEAALSSAQRAREEEETSIRHLLPQVVKLIYTLSTENKPLYDLSPVSFHAVLENIEMLLRQVAQKDLEEEDKNFNQVNLHAILSLLLCILRFPPAVVVLTEASEEDWDWDMKRSWLARLVHDIVTAALHERKNSLIEGQQETRPLPLWLSPALLVLNELLGASMHLIGAEYPSLFLSKAEGAISRDRQEEGEKIQESKNFVEDAYETCVKILRSPAVNTSANGKKLAEELWAVEGHSGKCSVDGVILLPEPVSQALLVLLATLLNSRSLADKFINEGHTTAFDVLLTLPACCVAPAYPSRQGGSPLPLPNSDFGSAFSLIVQKCLESPLELRTQMCSQINNYWEAHITKARKDKEADMKEKINRAKDAAKAFSSGSAPASYDPVGPLLLSNSRGAVSMREFTTFILPMMRRSSTDCRAALEICTAITLTGEGVDDTGCEGDKKTDDKNVLDRYAVHIFTKEKQQDNIAKMDIASNTSGDPDARAGRAIQRLCSRIICAIKDEKQRAEKHSQVTTREGNSSNNDSEPLHTMARPFSAVYLLEALGDSVLTMQRMSALVEKKYFSWSLPEFILSHVFAESNSKFIASKRGLGGVVSSSCRVIVALASLKGAHRETILGSVVQAIRNNSVPLCALENVKSCKTKDEEAEKREVRRERLLLHLARVISMILRFPRAPVNPSGKDSPSRNQQYHISASAILYLIGMDIQLVLSQAIGSLAINSTPETPLVDLHAASAARGLSLVHVRSSTCAAIEALLEPLELIVRPTLQAHLQTSYLNKSGRGASAVDGGTNPPIGPGVFSGPGEEAANLVMSDAAGINYVTNSSVQDRGDVDRLSSASSVLFASRAAGQDNVGGRVEEDIVVVDDDEDDDEEEDDDDGDDDDDDNNDEEEEEEDEDSFNDDEEGEHGDEEGEAVSIEDDHEYDDTTAYMESLLDPAAQVEPVIDFDAIDRFYDLAGQIGADSPGFGSSSRNDIGMMTDFGQEGIFETPPDRVRRDPLNFVLSHLDDSRPDSPEALIVNLLRNTLSDRNNRTGNDFLEGASNVNHARQSYIAMHNEAAPYMNPSDNNGGTSGSDAASEHENILPGGLDVALVVRRPLNLHDELLVFPPASYRLGAISDTPGSYPRESMRTFDAETFLRSAYANGTPDDGSRTTVTGTGIIESGQGGAFRGLDLSPLPRPPPRGRFSQLGVANSVLLGPGIAGSAVLANNGHRRTGPSITNHQTQRSNMDDPVPLLADIVQQPAQRYAASSWLPPVNETEGISSAAAVYGARAQYPRTPGTTENSGDNFQFHGAATAGGGQAGASTNASSTSASARNFPLR